MKMSKSNRERTADLFGAFAVVLFIMVAPIGTGLGLIGWVSQPGSASLMTCLFNAWTLGAGAGLILGTAVGIGFAARD